MSAAGHVIVGAGEAGVAAGVALRDRGYDGPITLIGAEAREPYERPPLSKAVILAGAPEPPPIGAAGRLRALDIQLRTGVAATGIDWDGRRLFVDDGDTLFYDKLLLATGARARPLSAPGGELALTLRTYDDSLAIRAALDGAGRVVIIGGGFIGLELAASARQRGVAVTLIEAAPRVLMRGVDAGFAAMIAARHRAEGVDLRTGTGLAAIAADGAGRLVTLADGEVVRADCVIAGIGAAPDTRLAAAAGLALDSGIAVDGRLQTSDPDIFATGDCCSFPSRLYGGRRIRLEAWRNAQDQGAFVAGSMLGGDALYTAVPWFWSDQYDMHLQIAGLADGATSRIERDQGGGA
eukprot:gene29562-33252_t